eukprot:GHVS01038625.1.p1 GENE.GHVS01038625.1~~GHVS01038625.1.p1  ORF type:complete len:263 (-),score=28.01 GHVS01038625.1:17-805(-)
MKMFSLFKCFTLSVFTLAISPIKADIDFSQWREARSDIEDFMKMFNKEETSPLQHQHQLMSVVPEQQSALTAAVVPDNSNTTKEGDFTIFPLFAFPYISLIDKAIEAHIRSGRPFTTGIGALVKFLTSFATIQHAQPDERMPYDRSTPRRVKKVTFITRLNRSNKIGRLEAGLDVTVKDDYGSLWKIPNTNRGDGVVLRCNGRMPAEQPASVSCMFVLGGRTSSAWEVVMQPSVLWHQLLQVRSYGLSTPKIGRALRPGYNS